MKVWSGLLLTTVATQLSAATPLGQSIQSTQHVLELRQYKIVPGQREAFVTLFDREFVDSQEAVGIRVVGQFTDRERADRFTWLRDFPDMDSRSKSLNAFYYGSVWKAHRETANPMLDDNDNVLLLQPASPALAFGPPAPRAAPGEKPRARGLIIAVIQYLWKNPEEEYVDFFEREYAPALRAAGLPVLGGYIAEQTPNNFPRLPVRQGEKIFVWFARADSHEDYEAASRRLESGSTWRRRIRPSLAQFEERPAQRLYLDPTPRSALR